MRTRSLIKALLIENSEPTALLSENTELTALLMKSQSLRSFWWNLRAYRPSDEISKHTALLVRTQSLWPFWVRIQNLWPGPSDQISELTLHLMQSQSLSSFWWELRSYGPFRVLRAYDLFHKNSEPSLTCQLLKRYCAYFTYCQNFLKCLLLIFILFTDLLQHVRNMRSASDVSLWFDFHTEREEGSFVTKRLSFKSRCRKNKQTKNSN